MLRERHIQAASDLLYQCWQDGRRITALPDEVRPSTRAEGYAIQALLDHRTAGPLFGWKIAATSLAGQAHIAVDGPLAGRLLSERVFGDGARLSLAGNRMRVAEPEFAFRMGHDLVPRTSAYGTDEVLDAVETLHPAIEVPDSRFEDFVRAGAPQLLADDACAHLFVLGAATEAPWRSIDIARHPVQAMVNGGAPLTGGGENVLGDPRIALTWLVNEVSALGIVLKAGQIVTTGTCMTPIPLAPGDAVEADFGALGRVAVQFES
ncbi:hydratase (plasmid) [Skermanella sp. TT6]|uniref:Hydratase n=1 Tax=Skermanella cutis TaxID=2775420 RepID=A0ABX7BF98_9PROT|nr:fumarylacetoacetate hydrolase family protein [Skermanella sp. TT6]QQP93071.1 hydratase [Skermanella sp. TT6]